ncbi:hypothetical protein F0L74_20915 [Chitinophaga agrisoli]|uniref:Uncharacterized protein n=1 Tax=Chitinophaga agrisoli TaxID=2607653 RepID=A0A5B2VGI9_9BACT|nr:hypothetical protein [Chitinophaga agrisoli]KAA2238683.1 hypothetical protein F0L74_20915 [Chitinophaga agrisoli]
MALFTFKLQFRGGIYISQVEGDDVNEVLVRWVKNLKVDEIQYFGEKNRELLLAEIESGDTYTLAINDTTNVWILFTILRPGNVTLHIIKTLAE